MEADKTELFLISRGNEIAFDHFMDSYSPRLYHYAYGLLGNREMAEEIVSDVFLEVWKRRRTINKIENMPSWLTTMTYRKSISVLRKESKRKNIPLDIIGEFHIPEEPDFTADIISHEEMTALYNAMENLPPKCKHVFFLAKIEKMRHDEIAKMLNITPATVNYHVTHAMTELKKVFSAAEKK